MYLRVKDEKLNEFKNLFKIDEDDCLWPLCMIELDDEEQDELLHLVEQINFKYDSENICNTLESLGISIVKEKYDGGFRFGFKNIFELKPFLKEITLLVNLGDHNKIFILTDQCPVLSIDTFEGLRLYAGDAIFFLVKQGFLEPVLEEFDDKEECLKTLEEDEVGYIFKLQDTPLRDSLDLETYGSMIN